LSGHPSDFFSKTIGQDQNQQFANKINQVSSKHFRGKSMNGYFSTYGTLQQKPVIVKHGQRY